MKSKKSIEELIKAKGICYFSPIACDHTCLFKLVKSYSITKCMVHHKKFDIKNYSEYRYDKAIKYYISKYGEEELFKLLI